MNLHHTVDRLFGRWIASRPQAPLRDTPRELEELARLDPEQLHPHVAAPRLHWVGGARADRLRRDRWRFLSPCPSGYLANDEVRGVRWRAPAGHRADVALIAVHGGFAPNLQLERLIYGRLPALGLDVVAPELPYHMQRQPAGSQWSGQYLFSGDASRQVRALVQAAADVRALILALRGEGYRRVFLAGISLGGNVAAVAASLEPVEGICLTVPMADPYLTLWHSPASAGIRCTAAAGGFHEIAIRQALRGLTPTELAVPATPLSRQLLIYGRHDLICPAQSVEALHAHWRRPVRRLLTGGHQTSVLQLFELRRQISGWASAALGGTARPRVVRVPASAGRGG
jgi:pimeloyl-ACP methyl ester carboxylesterase